MRKGLLSIGIVLAYIFIVLFFPRLQYYFSVNLEIIKLIISAFLVIGLVLTRQLSVNQLKSISNNAHKKWLVYPAVFCAVLFTVWFGVYIVYFGREYLQMPSCNEFLSTTLVLIATVTFEEVIARAFLTNTLINIWGKKPRIINCVVVFCGGLFGVLHFFNYSTFSYLSVTQSLFATFLGIYLCLAYVMTNSIIETILIHTTFNFSSYVNLLIFNTEIFPQNNLSMVSNIIFTTIFILSIPLFFISVKRMRKTEQKSMSCNVK